MEPLEIQKKAIYEHPLFPLLEIILQKCKLVASNEASAESFNEDIAKFCKTTRLQKSYYTPDPEVDSLMVLAIQVLRFHLLEIEKVYELSDSFCHRMSDILGKEPRQAYDDSTSDSDEQPADADSTSDSDEEPVDEDIASNYFSTLSLKHAQC